MIGSMNSSGQERWRGYAVLAAGALITLAFMLGHYGSDRLRDEQQSLLMVSGKELSESFKSELQHAISIIEATTWLFHASHEVDRKEFRTFAGSALRANPNVRELRWSPLLTDVHRQEFIAKVREQGLADFELREERPNTSKIVTAARRAEYYPVLYTEPARDEVLGFDIYSRTDDRWAMHAALEQKRPFATAVLEGVSDDHAITIHVPVFEQLNTEAAPANTPNLVGYVTGVVTLDGLLAAMRQKVGQMEIDVLLFDNTNKTQQVLAYIPGKHSKLSAEEAATKYRILKTGSVLPLEVAGRNWELVMHPNQEAVDLDMTYIWILVAGLLLTGVLVISVARSRVARVTADQAEG